MDGEVGRDAGGHAAGRVRAALVRPPPLTRRLSRNAGVPEGLRVGFTGHEQEDTLGLVDMRGRYYDPTQRRFLTPDPIIASPLSTQAFSPYAYVDNNPLSRIDPTGFWGEAADENGFMDEGDWDLSGMDAGTGASGGAGGGGSASGMAADYDDYDSGDMDLDPGEAVAGQDEQAGNDGNDDWSDSGSSKLRRARAAPRALWPRHRQTPLGSFASSSRLRRGECGAGRARPWRER